MSGIGFGISNIFFRYSVDPIAASFISTANITDSTERAAINYLVKALKGEGIWTKAKVIYPFVGSAATPCSYNLVNPALFQITWVNNPLFSDLGVQFNGTTNYGRTGFIPSAQFTIHDSALSVYSRSDINSNAVAMGVTSSATSQFRVQLRNAGNLVSPIYSATNILSVATGDSIRLTTISKTAVDSLKAFKLGVQVGATQTGCVGTLPTHEIYLGAANGAGAASNFWGGQMAFAGVFSGLTDSECAALDRIIETFQE